MIPQSVEIDEDGSGGEYAKFIFGPMEKGYSITLGEALKRALFHSVKGTALVAVKNKNGMELTDDTGGSMEKMSDLLLNLSELVFHQTAEGPVVNTIQTQGPGTVYAGDITTAEKTEILNTDHRLCNLNEGEELHLDLYSKKGLGFLPAEELEKEIDIPGAVILDSHFAPFRRVTYDIQRERVGHRADFESMIFEFMTDGTISPRDAMKLAGSMLISYLELFINFDEKVVEETEKEVEQESEEEKDSKLDKSVSELLLSVRAENCLKSAGINTIDELVSMSESDLLRLKSFGRKSLQEIKKELASMGLVLGMKRGGN